ncbi:cell division protein SepF [Azotosporobacter soli]|jgi:cell division inhibitor SepF|uniref:cell division protein SepF n=1 Tax=Azotosporobacter soli TaxID=3055040 RepID=UPI0031FEBE9A
MKFMDKVWSGLGLFEPVESEEESRHHRNEEAEMEPQRGKKGSNVVNLTPSPSKQMRVMVVEPISFDDAQHIADHLKNRKPVVVNFENCDEENSNRMVDFISGTVYALGGSIQKVGARIFLCAPSNVDVSAEDDQLKAYLPWESK